MFWPYSFWPQSLTSQCKASIHPHKSSGLDRINQIIKNSNFPSISHRRRQSMLLIFFSAARGIYASCREECGNIFPHFSFSTVLKLTQKIYHLLLIGRKWFFSSYARSSWDEIEGEREERCKKWLKYFFEFDELHWCVLIHFDLKGGCEDATLLLVSFLYVKMRPLWKWRSSENDNILSMQKWQCLVCASWRRPKCCRGVEEREWEKH